MIFAKEIAFVVTLFFLLFVSSGFAYGADVSWSTCPGGGAITHCQTINCREGDTNQDGTCTLADNRAELTSSRSDALCANPPSGCGEVSYFDANSENACIKRVKETGTNCNLYNVSTPRFASPSPSPTPTSVSKFTLGATSTPKPLAKTLPTTGPEPFIYSALALSGLAGIILFLRFR